MHAVPFLIGTLCILCFSLHAGTLPTYSEYEKQLSLLVKRDQQLREQIAQEQSRILECKLTIDESKKRTQTFREQKYRLLGITPEYAQQICAHLIEATHYIEDLLRGQRDVLLADTTRIASVRMMFDTLLHDPVCRLPAVHQQLNALQSSLSEVSAQIETQRAKLPIVATLEEAHPSEIKSKDTIYIVSMELRKAETLFSIANKVYGDPLKWPVIYRANKTVIDSTYKRFSQIKKSPAIIDASDFILPGQKLVIPR